MYEWINGHPTLMLRAQDLGRWPGHGAVAKAPNGKRFASVRQYQGGSLLVLRDPELTTMVPLELGGVMLVTAVYCDGDRSVAAHLDLVPIAGWEPLPVRFRADVEEYVLFDGSLSGAQLADPALEEKILAEHGGVVKIALTPGEYDVETLGPWNPDDRTELWLTRLVRSVG